MIKASDFELGLYVHWPFCQKRCPYCDFNVHEVGQDDPTNHERWQAALVKELQHFAPLAEGRKLRSIFFGGGTPSLMEPETVAGVIDAAQRYIGLRNDVEISLEANPTSADAERFQGYRQAGVNRLSLGIQSLRSKALIALGRQHTLDEALDALGMARQVFDNISFDLIYARPKQTWADWEDELQEALALNPDHISLYQLTIEPNTIFEQLTRKGIIRPKDEDETADFYMNTRAHLSAAGYAGYEVSNHSRAPEFSSQHNQLYWKYQDYIGIGPGAHGRLTTDGHKMATRQHRAPQIWLDRVEAEGHATATVENLSNEQMLSEALPFGLRVTEGLPLEHFTRLGGGPLPQSRLETLLAEGFITTTDGILKTTDTGRPVIDALARFLQA